MADSTPLSYRNLSIYEIYVRSHGPSGTFACVEADLERIQSMGIDIVWFMPIHAIGKLNAKGSLGCPYSIADYKSVNPEYGTLDDFKRLVDRAHSLGLLVMIDVVYNHTSHDSVYLKEHPDWYHLGSDGKPVTTVPEWSDVIDLNHEAAEKGQSALWESLVDALKFWVQIGVDGFRCDVASIVPLSFWKMARREVEKVKSGVVWLAETVHPGFVVARRGQGRCGQSDSEMYQAFDITYDYDIFSVFQSCLAEKISPEHYLEFLLQQDAIYPSNYCKLRFVENHDQPRIASCTTKNRALAWTAFQALWPGAFLVYAGQESGAVCKPSLFEKESVEWRDYEFMPFISSLCHLKKRLKVTGDVKVLKASPVLQTLSTFDGDRLLYSAFNIRGVSGLTPVLLPDGHYQDLISQEYMEVRSGMTTAPESVFVVECPAPLNVEPFEPLVWHFKIE